MYALGIVLIYMIGMAATALTIKENRKPESDENPARYRPSDGELAVFCLVWPIGIIVWSIAEIVTALAGYFKEEPQRREEDVESDT